MSFSRRAAAVLGGALSATALTLAAAAPAQAATTGWRVVFTYHYGSPKNGSGYLTVIAPGRHDAWAFGGTDLSGATAGAPVAEHWNGTAWKGSALPSGTTSSVIAASADSPSDIWAVTQFGGDILHWNGTAWSVAEQLTGVTALSPTDVWVFGGGGFTGGLGTWHFNGSTWTQQTGSAAGTDHASALSPTDIWAIGGVKAPQSTIVHYDGTTWARVKASALSGLQFNDILALSRSDIWVSATAQTNSFKAYLLHLTSSGWARISLPWRASPGRIASDGHGGLWWSIGGSGKAWMAHWSASGKWSRTPVGASGSGILSLAQIPGSTSLWGAGVVATTPAGANAAVWAHGTP